MSVQVTMLQTRRGEDGNLWLAGQQYTATDAFARLLVSSNLATATFDADPQSSLSVAQMVALQGLVAPKIADQGAAARNRAAIQAALDRKGSVSLEGAGIAWIDDTLLIDDDTTLTLAPSLEIKMMSTGTGLGRNLLATKAYADRANTTGISFANGVGLLSVVTWPNHGLTVQDYIWVQGATEGVYNQVFRVRQVLTADTFEVALPRLPSAAAAGTILAKRCTRNFHVSGGRWNYNNTENTTRSGDLRCMAMVPSIAGFFSLRNLTLVDCSQRGVQLGGVADYTLDGITCEGTKGDTVKVYGPAARGKISKLLGMTGGDDGCSVQPKEADPYAQYRYTSGDVLGLTFEECATAGRNDAGAAGAAFCVYVSPNERVDGLVYRKCGAYHEQSHGFAIKVGDDFAGGRVESVRYEDCMLAGDPTSRGIVCSADVGLLEIVRPRFSPAAGGQAMFRQTLNSIDQLVLEGMVDETCKWASTSTSSLIDISSAAAACRVIEVRGCTLKGSSASFGRVVYLAGAPVVDTVRLTDNSMESLLQAVRVDSGSSTTRRVLVDGGRYASMGQVVDARDAASVAVRAADFSSITGGVLRCQTDAAVSKLYGGEACTYSSAAPVVCLAPHTADVYGWDLPIDIGATGINKTAGAYCFNTGSGRGTIPQNRAVVCDGTSWFNATNLSHTF